MNIQGKSVLSRLKSRPKALSQVYNQLPCLRSREKANFVKW